MKKLICLLLSLVLALALLNGCSKKDKDVTSSDDPSSDVSGEDTGDLNQPDDADEPSDDDTDASSDNQNAGDSNDQSLSDSNTDSTTNTSNNNVDTPQEQKPAPAPEEPDDSGEPEEEALIDGDAIDLYVYNSQEPISTRYRGFSGTVWHAYGFMKDDSSGRVYTDKMMKEELKRLTDSGIHYTRTLYNISWAWNNVSGYDFSTNRFGYFCDYARALQERDVSVIINLGWHFGFISGIDTYSIPCGPNYLQGNGADRYGESTGKEDVLAGLSAEDQRIYKAGRRWGYAYIQTLNQLRALGINNISHLLYFTEASNGYSMPEAGLENEAYVLACSAIKEMLQEGGIADTVKHIGPNETSENGDVLLKYVMDNAPDLFDVISCHKYATGGNITNDVYYDIVQPIFDSYRKHVESAGKWGGDAEFWVDEWNCRQWSLGQKDHPAYVGLQNSFTAIMAQQTGIDNIISWQLFDQLWTDNSSDGGEWENGIHVTGFVHSLFESPLPYEQFYTQSLFTRYQGYKNGTIYPTNLYDLCENYEGIYIGSVLLEDGNWTITVLNLSELDSTFYVHFDEAIDKTLYRHQLTTGDIEVTPDARLKDADLIYLDVQDIFYDSIPAGSMAIYTSIKG